MRQIHTDQLWEGDLKYRPDEEPPENISAITFAHITRRRIFVSGLFTSIFGAIVAILAGLAISTSSPLWILAATGSLLASGIGWFSLSRRHPDWAI